MMMATSALEDFDSGMATVHQFPITGRIVKGFFCLAAEAPGSLGDFTSSKLALFSGVTTGGQSIVLIGFMGAGKSSVGKALARKTGLPLFDTDKIIESRFGLPVTEIFARFGEEKFRQAETETLGQLPEGAPAIIVTGGGIVLRSGNVKMLRALGRVVSLEADEETLFRRISRRARRPLLQTENPRATLVELLRVRAPLYRGAADVRLDTSRLTRDEVAEAILKSIAKP